MGVRKMKPSHAAALALVGWYLMVPPRDGIVLNAIAPLRQWQIAGSYDSAVECTKSALGLRQQARSYTGTDVEHIAVREQAVRALCIASDDRRLGK